MTKDQIKEILDSGGTVVLGEAVNGAPGKSFFKEDGKYAVRYNNAYGVEHAPCAYDSFDDAFTLFNLNFGPKREVQVIPGITPALKRVTLERASEKMRRLAAERKIAQLEYRIGELEYYFETGTWPNDD